MIRTRSTLTVHNATNNPTGWELKAQQTTAEGHKPRGLLPRTTRVQPPRG
jgi:hypothetical protein